MSLESKIETLTASIDRLSDLLEKLGSVEPAEVIKKEAEILREEAKAEEKQVETEAPEKQLELELEPKTTAAPTAEALQAKCMELVRADRKNKQVIKDLLAVYSASLISDLDEAQRAELAVKLGAL